MAVVLSLNGGTEVGFAQSGGMLNNGDATIIDHTTTIGFRIVPEAGDCYLILLRKQFER